MKIDTWSEHARRLWAVGWVFLNMHRYEPTHLDGKTPDGRVFEADFVGDVLTLRVGLHTRKITRSTDDWLSGEATAQALEELWQLLPANQQ